jgi:hypothetical protein
MTTLLGSLTEQLGLESGTISRSLGADEAATKSAIGAALPLMLGALQRNASRPEGAAALGAALERDHDGSLLDNLGELIASPDQGSGDGILRHVLGGRRSVVEAGLSRSSGLDSGQMGKLMTMLAPMLMGALGRTRRERDLDVAGLTGLLTDERDAAESEVPELSGLAGLLDSDDDGQVLDDVAKLGSGLLGGLFRRR